MIETHVTGWASGTRHAGSRADPQGNSDVRSPVAAQLLFQRFDVAAELYETNCTQRHFGESCLNLAALLTSGKLSTLDPERPAALLRRGCELGSGRSCFWAALSTCSKAGVPDAERKEAAGAV